MKLEQDIRKAFDLAMGVAIQADIKNDQATKADCVRVAQTLQWVLGEARNKNKVANILDALLADEIIHLERSLDIDKT